ncbi:MAG: AzlD domain-containing protein [Thermoplasmatota archaeon]
MNGWLLAGAAGAVTIAIRLLPEAWLRGREPAPFLARTLPWVPVAVAGALIGVLHLGAASGVRVGYLLAAIPAAATLLWRRSFYFPIVAGAVTLALLRLAHVA